MDMGLFIVLKYCLTFEVVCHRSSLILGCLSLLISSTHVQRVLKYEMTEMATHTFSSYVENVENLETTVVLNFQFDSIWRLKRTYRN